MDRAFLFLSGHFCEGQNTPSQYQYCNERKKFHFHDLLFFELSSTVSSPAEESSYFLKKSEKSHSHDLGFSISASFRHNQAEQQFLPDLPVIFPFPFQRHYKETVAEQGSLQIRKITIRDHFPELFGKLFL
jgi:hypothetical protein